MKKYFYIFFLLLISFISVLNLFHSGYPLTHDGDVHLLRLTNFYQSLKEGNIIPRWAANVNFGYGQPVFEFFYPLPLYLASFLHLLGLSFSDSLKTLLILGMVLSAVSMFFWLSEIFNKQAAFIGGILYVFTPFRFIDTYVRGDIGENLAFIFVPLVLYFICKMNKKAKLEWSFFGGISFACLILTHNIISLIFIPFILFYGLFCFLGNKSKKEFTKHFIIIFALGFALSAFFWIPGLLEGKYTLRDIVTRGVYKDSFVSFQSLIYGPWSYGISGQFTVQLGIINWIAFLLSFVVLLFNFFILLKDQKIKNKHTQEIFFILSVVLYVAIGIFFMLPVSNFIWSKIILLQNFQFTWRFLSITVFGTAILAAYLIQISPQKYVFGILPVAVILVLFFNRNYMHAKEFIYRSDIQFIGIQKSPADTGESSPLWGIRFMEHGYSSPLQLITGDAEIVKENRTTVSHLYLVNVKKQSRFLENTLYFPGWEILANNNSVPIEFQDQRYRGLMTFNLPKGNYIVNVRFVSTKLRRIADLISLFSMLISFLFFNFFVFRGIRKKERFIKLK